MNLYRKAIDSLDWGETAIVIGHKSPDGDSVMAALAYAYLMRALGHQAVARMAGKANNETIFAAKAFGIEMPEILLSAPVQTRLILVDHSDYAQAVEGARNARILQVIDHHGIGDIAESKLLYAKYMPVGSTCSIVYTSFKELDVEITPDVAKILLAGILSDTLNLKKVTTTDVDRAIYKELLDVLAPLWGLDGAGAEMRANEIFKGMSDAAHDFSAMTDEEIFNSDAKDYVVNGVQFRLGSLDWDHPESIENFLDRMLRVMNGAELMFCRIGCLEHSYILYNGCQNVAESAFGKSVRPGVIYCERRLSRKLDVVPMLTKSLQ